LRWSFLVSAINIFKTTSHGTKAISSPNGRVFKITYLRSDVIINTICNAIRLLSALFEPYMPSLSAKINFLLNLTRTEKDETILASVHEMKNSQELLSLIPYN